MNTKHLLSAAAALSMLAACSDYDPGLSENAVNVTDEELTLIKEFEANFIEHFGDIDPTHTWGFGEVGSEDEVMETRTVLVNNNEWYVRSQELVYPTEEEKAANPNAQPHHEYVWHPNTQYLPENAVIPGMPSVVDGKYYTSEGVFNTLDELKNSGNNAVHPIGDVTDEEIVYVSNWFRTHPNPKSEVPKFTEFFIQDVPQDCDRISYPDGKWIDTNLPVHNPDGTLDNGKDPITYGMDYFATETSENKEDHINNYNKGKANWISETNPTNYNLTFAERTIQYWKTDGGYTTNFTFHNSDNNMDYDNFVLVHLTFTGPVSGKPYDCYYLAFDYEYYKNNSGKWSAQEPDGYYSNWIVKLSPANPDFDEETPPTPDYDHKWYRIMCEDLGTTDDYDFNDLVYDVYYTGTSGNYTANIMVRAVGGTLPIYLNNLGTGTELHELLGDTKDANSGLYHPLNVGGKTAAPQPMTISNLRDTNPDNIDVVIYANPSGSSLGNNVFILPTSGKVSPAPQKICIPGNTTRWTRERQQIDDAYPHFVDWAKKQTGPYRFPDWVEVKNGNSVIGWNLEPASGVTPWNTTDVNATYLY